MKIGQRTYYAGALDIPEGTSGKWAIKHEYRPVGFSVQSGNMRTTLYGQRSQNITFHEPTRWHKLVEDGNVWMTDWPIEQRQMDEMIRGASGDVLVGGLGLGYAAIALANRSKVRHVTVVEVSPDVIALTWDATKRTTKYPNKLSVVEMDLFSFLAQRKGREAKNWPYTWGLFDIWQADSEHTFHEIVVPLRALAHGVVKKLVCWNEDVMRGQLFQGIEMRLRYAAIPRGVYTNDPETALKMKLPTLDDLCKSHNVYTDWAIPFWKWVRDQGIDLTTLTEDQTRQILRVGAQYTQIYGRPEYGNGLRILEWSKVL